MVKHVGYLVTTVVVSLALVLMPVTSVVHAQGFLDELRDAGESLDKLRGAAESMQELGKTLGNLTGATDGQPAQEDRLNPATNQPHNEAEHTGHVRTQREWGEIQARLNELGYNAGPVDGIPGRGTRRAIAAFESANALDRDGHVDPLMLQVLFSHDAQAMPEVVSRPSRTFTSDGGSETVSRPETAIIDATRTGGSPGSTAKLCENLGFAAGKEGSKFTRLTDALHDKIGVDFEQAKRYFGDKPGYRLLFHPLLKTSIRGDSENLFEKEWQAARIDLEVCFISRYIAYWLVYLSLKPERLTEDVAIGFSNRILRTVATYVDGVIGGARLDKGYPAPDVLDAYERFFQRFVKTSIYVPYYGHTRLSLRTGGHSDLIIRSTQIIRNAPRYDYTEIPGLASRVLEGRATLLGEAMSIEVEGRPEEILSAEYVAWIGHIDKTYANYSQEEQIATLLSQSTIRLDQEIESAVVDFAIDMRGAEKSRNVNEIVHLIGRYMGWYGKHAPATDGLEEQYFKVLTGVMNRLLEIGEKDDVPIEDPIDDVGAKLRALSELKSALLSENPALERWFSRVERASFNRANQILTGYFRTVTEALQALPRDRNGLEESAVILEKVRSNFVPVMDIFESSYEEAWSVFLKQRQELLMHALPDFEIEVRKLLDGGGSSEEVKQL